MNPAMFLPIGYTQNLAPALPATGVHTRVPFSLTLSAIGVHTRADGRAGGRAF